MKLPAKMSLAAASILCAATAVVSHADSHGNMGRSLDQAPTRDFFTTVVAPGKGANCQSSPCRIYYLTPDLGAPVEVVANNFSVGTFAPGKYADLGNFTENSVRITVPNGDVPTAFVDIYDPSGSG